MTCPPGPPTFRLLDAYVGWDEHDVCRLTGLDDPGGIRLAPADGAPGPRRHDLLPWLPDPRLAPGCGRCAWYLAAPTRGLLRREPCPDGFESVWPPDCDPALLGTPVAVAARGHVVAVADAERVLVWRRDGEQLAASIPVAAHALALTSWHELLVATTDAAELRRFDLTGAPRAPVATGVSGRVEALTSGRDCTIWLLTSDADGTLRLWRGHRDAEAFTPATPEELAAAVDRSTLTAISATGFCLTEPGEDGDPATVCWTWDGRPLSVTAVGAPAPPPLATTGQLLTVAVDSGVPRCRWHRVRMEADVPAGTSVAVAVASSETATPPGAASGPSEWQGCPGGIPHPDDWQQGPPGARDVLVDQPPGRYLYVRLRLSGDGTASPTVRRLRLDFPRVTSAELLPPAYRQDPAAEDFTERFLSLFDASLEELDRAVERAPALLAARDVPDEVLPWLASLLGLAFEPDWDATTRRELLTAAPELYRRRGTPWALRTAIRIVFKVEPVIHELAPDRDWAALGGWSRLRSTRLFGRSAARFRVDGSALSRAPLRSFGNPDDDPLTAQANRFRVLLPPRLGRREPDVAALTRLVDRQAPAHTVPEVRLGGLGFVVGTWSAVGVDTAFTPLPAPVLGVDAPGRRGRAVRLHRHSVIWPGRAGRRMGVRVGTGSAVGIGTVAE
jgi:phage tail-like protein